MTIDTSTPRRKGTPLRPRLKRNLALGQTPFDDLDRETLIRLLCAHQSALDSARSALEIARNQAEAVHGGLGPFWVGPYGVARRAMYKIDYLIGLVAGRKREHAHAQQRAYGRHVDELTFLPDPAEERPEQPTMVCDRCAVWCQNLSGNDPRPFQGNLRLCGPGGRDCPAHRVLTWEILRAGDGVPAEA